MEVPFKNIVPSILESEVCEMANQDSRTPLFEMRNLVRQSSPLAGRRPLPSAKWATRLQESVESETLTDVLEVSLAERPSAMVHSNATGEALLSNGLLGVDTIRVPRGGGFAPHTHPGDHLLIVVGGEGTLTYNGRIWPTEAGEAYMIEGNVPHAVGAVTDHVILAVGSPHRPIDSPERMSLVDYAEVLSELGSVQCMICHVSADYPAAPHDAGCSHCPCASCLEERAYMTPG